MDLYDENFKLQDMIDSDMRSLRSELDEYFLPHSPGSPNFTAMTPVLPMDIEDRTLDSEISDDGGIGWMNCSQIYNISSDLDSVGGILVNPQTALPVSVTQLSTPTTTSISSAFSGTVNVTLTPQVNDSGSALLTPNDRQSITLPVQVIATTATLVSAVDNKHSQVNLTVAVPTPISNSVGTQVTQQIEFGHDGCDSPKLKSKQKQGAKLPHICMENAYPKPAYSYSCLIAMALKNSRTGSLPVNEIYDFMTENFPYFKTAPNGWKNSVRHNLSLNKCFEKIEKPSGNGAQRKGYLWALNPARVEKMEEELQKWGSKDPAAIRKSMANPERLELIEKGELRNYDSDIKPSEKKSSLIESENENGKSVNDIKVKTEVDCLNAEMTVNDFSTLGETVSMDSSLPDLDLQKGIWENLCEDRLQFLSDSPINSSSPKHSLSSQTLDEDSSSVTSPSDLPKSFIHANYIYTYAQRTSTDSSNSHQLNQHSMVTATEKSTICDV